MYTSRKHLNITGSEISSIIRSLRYASALPVYSANRSMFHRMVEGENFVREDRSAKDFYLRLIDFDETENKNIVKIVNQMTVRGPKATRRPDAIVYINGLPVVVMEFKSAIKEDTTIHDAYVQITTRYMRDIPELFKYNCFAVLSDGVNTKAGSIFADYEHFYSWRRIEADDHPADGIDALDTMIQGMFRKERLYDINIELAKEIRAALRDKEKYADWANSAQIKAIMQTDIIIILAKHGYPPTPPEIYEKVYNDILEQAENFKKYSD